MKKQPPHSPSEPNHDLHPILALAHKAATADRHKPIEHKALKLCEEAGEVAAEVLKYIGYKADFANGKRVAANARSYSRLRIISELTDVQLMVTDLLTKLDATNQEIDVCIASAVDKWQKEI